MSVSIKGINSSSQKLEIMRPPRYGKSGLKKGTWSPEEDQKLVAYIRRYGIWNWSEIAKHAGLSRIGKSCRLRWVNYLCPGIKHGKFTVEEEETIIKMHEMMGNRWSAIATKLPGRTDNEIKNHWHSHLKKCVRDHPAPKSDSQEIKTCEANLNNLHETKVTLTAIKASNLEGFCNSPTSPYMSMSTGDYSLSSSAPAFNAHENQNAEAYNIDTSEQTGDLQSFWAQLLMSESLYMEDHRAPFLDPGFNILNSQEWLQDPSSPYGSNTYDYWLNLLYEADMVGMEEPNFFFKRHIN